MQSLVPSGRAVSQRRSQPQVFLLSRQLPRLSVEGHGRRITRKRTRAEATEWTDTEKRAVASSDLFIYTVLNFTKEIIFSSFGQKAGLSRSAIFLLVFVIIHAVGHLHVFLGRLYWTGFGLQANIVEERALLGALLHVSVALKRIWDISLTHSVASGKFNMVISGVTLLTFMTIHLWRHQAVRLVPARVSGQHFARNFAPRVFLGVRDMRMCQDSRHLPCGVRSFRIPWLGPVLHRRSVCVCWSFSQT